MIFSKFPYAVRIALSASSWAVLCAAFGYFLILSRADFETTGTRTLFIFSFPLYVMIAALFLTIEYGGLRFLGIREKRREIRVLNDNIKDDHLLPNLSTETIKEIFYSLTERPMDGPKQGLKYGGTVIFLSLLTEWLASGMTTNLLIILTSGLISLFLLITFMFFFIHKYTFPVLMECRWILLRRNERIKEPQFRFSSLKTKFNLFLLMPIIVVLVILSFIISVDLNIVILSLLGLGMAVMISRVLSFSIYQAFSGVKNFAQELPTGKRTIFSTGSLDAEIIDLSEALNKAAEEVYTSKEKVKKSERELKKKVEELEKWYNITVGRELRMIELKQEIKKLKEELKKQKG